MMGLLGLVPIQEETQEKDLSLSLPPPYWKTARRMRSASQEESSHKNLTVLTP